MDLIRNEKIRAPAKIGMTNEPDALVIGSGENVMTLLDNKLNDQ